MIYWFKKKYSHKWYSLTGETRNTIKIDNKNRKISWKVKIVSDVGILRRRVCCNSLALSLMKLGWGRVVMVLVVWEWITQGEWVREDTGGLPVPTQICREWWCSWGILRSAPWLFTFFSFTSPPCPPWKASLGIKCQHFICLPTSK